MWWIYLLVGLAGLAVGFLIGGAAILLSIGKGMQW
jgi:hypothetical protein